MEKWQEGSGVHFSTAITTTTVGQSFSLKNTPSGKIRSMNRDAQKRLGWIKLYEETRDPGLVCRRCGISRPILRKWWRRFQEEGFDGLNRQSKRSKHTLFKKVLDQEEDWILVLRRERKLGVRRAQNEFERQHDCSLSLSTIRKVLQKHQVNHFRKSDGVKK